MKLEIDEDGKIFWNGLEWCRLSYTDKANARSYLECLQVFVSEFNQEELSHDLDRAIEIVDAIAEAENWDAVSEEVTFAVEALKAIETTIAYLHNVKEGVER